MTSACPQPEDFQPLSCRACANGTALGFDFSMAFQPIVNAAERRVLGYEALARGLGGESAGVVMQQVNEHNLYRFDQTCRVKAINLAADLGIEGYVSINFMPNAVYKPELCIRTTLAAAHERQFPIERIVFEITEVEQVRDKAHLRNIIKYYQKTGFKTALDDFGAGYAGLNMLAAVTPDVLKIDRELIENIHNEPVKHTVVGNLLNLCRDLGITPLAEGVETAEEYRVLRDLGVNIFQGYLFARPAFEALPKVHWPE